MSAPEYWFARRFPVGSPRNSMAPVHWKGWAMFGAFLAAMAMGALGFALTALKGDLIMGAVAFASLSALGAGMLLISVAQHGDTARTVDEYRKAQRTDKTHA